MRFPIDPKDPLLPVPVYHPLFLLLLTLLSFGLAVPRLRRSVQ